VARVEGAGVFGTANSLGANYRGEMQSLLARVRAWDTGTEWLDEGDATMSVLDAIFCSARDGSRVEVSPRPPTSP
jgi:hypothetical protein